MSPLGLPTAWRYDPAALEIIAVGPDPFDDELVAAVEKAVVRGKQRFPLVGYTWPASDWTPARVTAMRKLSGESAGKQQYVGFLKERYGYSIERVNQIYGLESTSFSDLLIESFAQLDVSKPAVAADDRQFLDETASRLAQTIADTLHRAHPGALLFSEPLRAAGVAQDAFARYTDVLVSPAHYPAARAQVLLGTPPRPLPANIVGLNQDLDSLGRLRPIPPK